MPLQKVAEAALENTQEQRHYTVLQGDHFWIADSQLAQWDIGAADGQLAPKHIVDQGAVFLQPPIVLGKNLFIARRFPQRPGVLVSAMDALPLDMIWETSVATPLAGQPRLDGASGKITAITAAGAIFQTDPGDVRGDKIIDRPLLAVPVAKLQRSLNNVIAMDAGVFAIASGAGSNQIVLFDPQEKPLRLRTILVPGELACEPILLGRGLLAPCSSGQVFLLDPHSMGAMAEPFEPELKTDTAWKWRLPAAAGQKEAVISDGDRRLYRLEIAGDRTSRD
jgi:hypothetical protein